MSITMKKKKKRDARRRQSKLAVGVAWYSPEQWQRLREIAQDADSLHDTYQEWLSSVEKLIRETAASHVLIEKMDIDIEALVAWCNERNFAINGEARSQYVSEKLREKYEES